MDLKGGRVEYVDVPFEFQKGSNRMLRLRKAGCDIVSYGHKGGK